MSDYPVVFGVRSLIFFNKFERAGKSDVVYIVSDFIRSHTDPVILNGNGLRVLIRGNGYAVIRLVYTLSLADRTEMSQFCYRVARV